MSWTNGDRIVYEKEVVGGDFSSIESFTFDYPASKKDYYAPVVAHLNSTFNTPEINEGH